MISEQKLFEESLSTTTKQKIFLSLLSTAAFRLVTHYTPNTLQFHLTIYFAEVECQQ